MVQASRILRAAAVAGIAAFALVAAAGLYQSWSVRGGPPGISLDYMPAIAEMQEEGRLDEALRELRSANRVDPANVGVARELELVADQAGDRDARMVALRAQLHVEPFDASTRARLSEALTEQAQEEPPERARRTLSRAVWQAEKAVTIEPSSARAHRALGLALRAAGRDALGRAALERARQLDPSLAIPMEAAARP